MPLSRKPFRRRLKPLPHQQEQVTLTRQERWGQIWGWLLLTITVGLLLSLIPEYWAHRGGASHQPVAAKQGTPLWRSGFEQGWPREWRSRPGGMTDEAPGEPAAHQPSSGKILGKQEAQTQGVSVPQGNYIYQAQITASTTARPHRIGPVLAMEMVNPSYFTRPPKPLVNQFYVWVDWDNPSLSSQDWLNLVTLANNTTGVGVSLRVRGPKNQLELVEAGSQGGFKQGDGWEIIAPTESVNLPLHRWVKLTILVDYERPLLVVWLDGVPIFRANGGQLQPQAQSSPYLWRAHWGLTGASGLKKARVYNDDIRIWALPEPLTAIASPPTPPH